jgi:signal transduction histidine kinase/HPt (histidine-containing phosphotransfer) domain-containing protein
MLFLRAILFITTRFCLLKYWFYIFLSCLSLSTFAQKSVLTLSENIDKYALDDYISILVDKKGNLDIKAVSSLAYSNQFTETYHSVNQGVTQDTYWARIQIENPLKEDIIRLLQISNADLGLVELYEEVKSNNPIAPQEFKIHTSGIEIPFESREIKHLTSVFALHLRPNTIHTFYIKIRSNSNMAFPMTLWESNHFYRHDRLQSLLLGFYYGFVLVIILYNLFLFLIVKDLSYLFYVLYLAGFGLFQFISNGLGYEYLIPTPSWWSLHIMPMLAGCTVFFGSWFVKYFLHTATESPVYEKILTFIGLTGLLFCGISTFVNEGKAVQLTAVLGLVFVIAVIAATVHGLQKKYRPARFMFVAWIAFLLGVVMLSLHILGLLPTNFITVYGVQIGSALEMVLLSMALGDRINILKEEKQQAELEKEKMEQSKKFKEQFLAHVSHEIRTPMNAIIGFARLLSRSPINTIQKNHVQNIQRSADNLLVIINDILDVTKIESGRMTFEQVEIHLPTLCNALMDTMQFKVSEKNISLKYIINPDVPETITGDPVRLNQILLNLLSNAVKFTEKGFVKLEIKFLEEKDNKTYLRFEVADTGIGIPEDRIEVIFESFTQASSDTTRKFGGTGLGLTIVKQLTELQGGKIEVSSKLNEGSTFAIIMGFGKVNIKPEDVSAEKSIKETIEENNIPTAYILLCEDNPVNQTLAIQTICEFNPYIRIDTAENGKMGIEKLESNDYDLILMDMQMPIMDGYETTRYIRKSMPENKRNIPIIALTADVLQDNQQKALDAGMNDYIYKPFNASELFMKIEKLKIKSLKPSQEKAKFEVGNIRKTAMGNNEFMLELMNMFTDKIPDLIVEMKNFVKEKDWKSLSFIAHKNKMLFVVMGLTDLHQQLAYIELSSMQEENTDQLHDKVYTFARNCEEVARQITVEKGRLVSR